MITILLLNANPDDTVRLNLGDEIRAIDEALQRAKLGKHFDLRPHGAVRIDDLQKLLERYRPGIVHFSGHGSTAGEIILQDDQGKAVTVPVDALSNLFKQFSNNIRCVVLNTCHSDAQARAVARYIDCVIGMSDALSDKAALNFSTAFYRALGDEYSIQSAFEQGILQISLSNLKEEQKPKLIANRASPGQIVLTKEPALVQERLAYLDELKSLSRARCIERWQAAGLSRSEAIDFADNSEIGLLRSEYYTNPENPLIILIAEVGAGKSLIIEKLFQKAIARAVGDANAPVPIYFSATEYDGKFKEKVIAVSRILGDIEEQGATIFVDGLDEVDFHLAKEMLKEARISINLWQKVTVTFTSRPLPIFNTIEEVVKIPSISDQEAHKLIMQISKRDTIWLRGWPQSIQDAVRRPLFAVILGAYLKKENKTLRSKGELLFELVKRSLEQKDIDTVKSNYLLEKLATLCINNSGARILRNELASDEEIELLIRSRLVVEHSGVIGFPLPILTEWFAARSLLHGYPSLSELLINEQNLEKWRYPLTIFVAIFNYEQVSTILTPLCERFPAFASEILAESIDNWVEPEYDPIFKKFEYGFQILKAMKAWVKGIEPLAKLIAPVNEHNSLYPLGITLDKQYITYAWYNGQNTLSEINDLSDKAFIDSPKWSIVNSRKLGRQSAWIWEETHNLLVHALSRLLNNRDLPVTDGPIFDEKLWETALIITRRKSLWSYPISIEELQSCLQKFSEDTIYHMPRKILYPLDIKQLKARLNMLQDLSEREICPPWPILNLPIKNSDWFQKLDNSEHLLQYTKTVYQAAIQSYIQIVEAWFPQFASRLQTAATLPARFTGILEVFEKESGRSPIMQWYWDCLPSKSQSVVDICLGKIQWRSEPENIHTNSRENLRFMRPNSEKWLYTSLHHMSINNILVTTPINKITYSWLWDDLKKIFWVKGMLKHGM